jgi:hypothetical protein
VPRDYKIRGYTVGQSPNRALWIALVALLVALLSGEGALNQLARAVLYLSLAIWAYEELVRGVNLFRRLLGGLALALVAIALGCALG